MLEDFIEPGELFSDDQLDQIANAAGFELAGGYGDFVRKYGNAFIGGLVDGSPEFPILSFFNAEKIISTFDFTPAYRENKLLPVADCELGNTWVLGGDGSVHYVNFYNTPTVTRKVAESFSDFVSRIVIEDE